MIRKSSYIDKMLGLVLLTAPIFIEGAIYTWTSTSSSDLNTAGNWIPSGPPGTSDDAEFNSTLPGVVTSPAALTGVGFSVSTIDFTNTADVFFFEIPNGTLTFNGGGIGAAIPGSLTNATFNVSNIDNATSLTDQILFSGNPSTSGSAILVASNRGTTTSSTVDSDHISVVSYQIHSPNFFTVREGARLAATNSGANHFNNSSLEVGYIYQKNQILFNDVFNGMNVDDITLTVSNSGVNSGSGNNNKIGYVDDVQFNVFGNFFAGNNLNITVANTGEEDSTGTGGDTVGLSNDSQIELRSGLTVQNNATIMMTNTGTITGNVTGTNNQIGVISGNQLDLSGSLFAGNDLTLNASNVGTNNGSGSSNYTGFIQYGPQVSIGGAFTSGTNLQLGASNIGTNNGAGSNNKTGESLVQLSVGGAFRTGSGANITASNIGTNDVNSSGNANYVGLAAGQAIFGGDFTSGANTNIACSNIGTDNGSGNSNLAGYIQGQQFSVTGVFSSGANTIMNIENIGTFTNNGTGSNYIGYVVADQVSFNSTATFGDNAQITIINSGTSSAIGNNNNNFIGVINNNNQITTNGFLAGNDLDFSVINTGNDGSSGTQNTTGQVSYQCSHNGSFITSDNARVSVINTGTINGTATTHTVGSNSSGQFTVGGNFQAGNALSLSAVNIGIDNTTGSVSNSIATNFGQQILVDGTFSVGDDAVITALNKGINLNLTGTGTTGVLSGQDQFQCQGAFQAGKNLLLTVTNSAEGGAYTGTGVVGSCQNQLNFLDVVTLDNGSVISAANEGFGTVTANQIILANGFAVTSGSATIQASNSSAGTVTGFGIYITGTASGGDVNIGLTNTSLNVTSTATSFTLGSLNGDATSSVQSNIPLIIDVDAGVSSVFAGAIQDYPSVVSTLVKTGLGSQTLSGTSTYSGVTTVNGGSLVLNGALGAGGVSVSAGGTVMGNGAIDGPVTVDGTISPGNSIGTLQVASYVQNTGSFYDAEVNGSGQSDLIDVTGSATINGGTVVASTADGTYKFQTPYTILQAGTSISGTYSGATAASTMIAPLVTYDAQHVYLTLETNIVSAANTFNELAVAKQLDGITNPTALQNTLLSEIASLSAAEGTTALDSISGWQYTNQTLMAASVNAQFLTRLYDPIRCIVTSDIKCCCCSPCSETQQCCDDYTVWSEVGGSISRINGDGNAHTFRVKGWEATAGIQKTFLCDWTIGLAGSFEHDLIKYKHQGGSGQSNTWLGGLYALYRPSHFYTLVDFAYGYSFNDMNRSIHVGSLHYKGKGNPNVSQFTFYGECGADWRIMAVLLQPFVGIESGSYWRKGVTEKDAGGWALQVNKKSDSLAASRVGVHLTAGKLSGKVGSASLDLSWNKRLTGKNTTVTEEFVNFGEDFKVKGVHLNSNSFYYALTLARCINKNWKIQVKGEGNVYNHGYQFDGLAGVEYSW